MNIKNSLILRPLVLLISGLVYLTLFGAIFAFKIDLENDKNMQYILHITVILSAFAYLFFIDLIYGMEENKTNARIALIFGALFLIPVLIGRGIGLYFLSINELNDIYNFYGNVSVSRSVEMLSWTTLFPLSILYLGKVFYKQKKTILSVLCLLSSVCCFIAFLSFFSTAIIYMFIGVTGWGILFTIIIIIYLLGIYHMNKAGKGSKT